MTLKDGDVKLGSLDDTFYIAEIYLKKGGKAVGKVLGMTPKQIKRRNLLLKNLKELESKFHATHSPLQRHIRFIQEFKRPLIDVKIKKLKRILKKYPKIIS
jgi:hypothetical protein